MRIRNNVYFHYGLNKKEHLVEGCSFFGWGDRFNEISCKFMFTFQSIINNTEYFKVFQAIKKSSRKIAIQARIC